MSDPVTVVSRFVDAANRHDADAIARCLHPDFESIQPIYPSRNFRGSVQVKRNWQAIFESEPGFRLSLVRSASSESTVWVELHGAGRDVEVAGVFIMGVEEELVRWARVYSAVVEQPPPKMAAHEPEDAVAAEEPSSLQEEAEELRRLIDAGRPADADAPPEEVPAEDVPAAELVGDPASAEVPAAEVPAAEVPADVAGEHADVEDDGEDDDDEYDDADEYDDDDYDDDDEDDDGADEDGVQQVEIGVAAANGLGQAAGGGDTAGADRGVVAPGEVAGDEAGADAGVVAPGEVAAVAEPATEPSAAPERPSPYADPDAFWNGGEVHDLVGGAERDWRPDLEAMAAGGGALGDDEDAVVVDLTGRRAELGDDDEDDDTAASRSGRRRGGRRHR